MKTSRRTFVATATCGVVFGGSHRMEGAKTKIVEGSRELFGGLYRWELFMQYRKRQLEVLTLKISRHPYLTQAAELMFQTGILNSLDPSSRQFHLVPGDELPQPAFTKLTIEIQSTRFVLASEHGWWFFINNIWVPVGIARASITPADELSIVLANNQPGIILEKIPLL